VHEQFTGRSQIDVFLPLWERRSRWKDRIRRIQVPLFPSYCFARFWDSDRLPVLQAFGVVDLVGPSGEPEPIPDAEMDAIHALVGSGLPCEPFPFLAEGMAIDATDVTPV
jgi:transcription antitermination factor NusG